MRENPEDRPGSAEAPSDQTPQLGRRLFVFRAAAVLGGAAAATVAPPTEAAAKDFGSLHQDPEGSYHVQDVAKRRRYEPEDEESDNDPDDD